MGFLSNISNAVRRMGGNGREGRVSEPIPTLVPSYHQSWQFWGGGKCRPCRDYKNVIFFQFVKMIGVLFNDVELTYAGGGVNRDDFDKWQSWFFLQTKPIRIKERADAHLKGRTATQRINAP